MKLLVGLRKGRSELVLGEVEDGEKWTIQGEWIMVVAGTTGERRAFRIYSDVTRIVERQPALSNVG